MTHGKVTRIISAAFLFVALTGVWQTASAYTPGACREDGAKLCPGLTGAELTPCLKQHQGELSMHCQVNLAELREMVRQGIDACQAEIQKFCPGVKMGGGRIIKCLKTHDADLTAACKAQIAATEKKYQFNTSTTTPAAAPSGTK